MKKSLFTGLDEQEVQDLRADFKGCPVLRKRLVAILERDCDSCHAEMRKPEAYDTPNWTLKHAELLGRVKTNKRLISLLLDEE